MINNSKKAKLQQAFYDLADKLEQECENWQHEPVPPELQNRIMTAAMELEKE